MQPMCGTRNTSLSLCGSLLGTGGVLDGVTWHRRIGGAIEKVLRMLAEGKNVLAHWRHLHHHGLVAPQPGP